MKIKDLAFTKEEICGGQDKLFRAKTELGDITVLDRLTGFGFNVRDVETGFKDLAGNFWLASGDFDIRHDSEATIDQAIEKIKSDANTCRPEEGQP